jgi:hypothetical protein
MGRCFLFFLLTLSLLITVCPLQAGEVTLPPTVGEKLQKTQGIHLTVNVSSYLDFVKSGLIDQKIITAFHQKTGFNLNKDLHSLGVCSYEFMGETKYHVYIKGNFPDQTTTEKMLLHIFLHRWPHKNDETENLQIGEYTLHYNPAILLFHTLDEQAGIELEKVLLTEEKRILSYNKEGAINLHMGLENLSTLTVPDFLLPKFLPITPNQFFDMLLSLNLLIDRKQFSLALTAKDSAQVKVVCDLIAGIIGYGRLMMAMEEMEIDKRIIQADPFQLFEQDITGRLRLLSFARMILEKVKITPTQNQALLTIDFTKEMDNQAAPVLTLALVGSAATVVVPMFKRSSAMAKKRACISNMKTLEGATELFVMEHDMLKHGAVHVQTLVDQGYMRQMPVCPSGGNYAIIRRGEGTPDARTEVVCTIHATLDDLTGL